MNQSVKYLLSVIVFLFGIISVSYVIYTVSTTPQLSSLENTLFSVLLTMFSGVASWVLADVYAKSASRRESAELIDRIGEQSSEKILNQSRQLWNIETYIENKRREISNDPAHKSHVEYLVSLIEMVRLVRSSNNTYLSDWAGVTSQSVKDKIDSQSRAQSEIFEDIEILIKSDFADLELKNRIIANSAKLPSYLAPTGSSIDGRVVSIVRTIYKTQAKDKSQGKIFVYLNRPVYKFTCSGKLDPPMIDTPNDSRARLDSKPPSTPEYAIVCSTGTNFDFHIHIKSEKQNTSLPVGLYTFSFIVRVIQKDDIVLVKKRGTLPNKGNSDDVLKSSAVD